MGQQAEVGGEGVLQGPRKDVVLKGLDTEKEVLSGPPRFKSVLLVTNFESLGRSEV